MRTLALVLLLGSCSIAPLAPNHGPPMDPHSYARPAEVAVEHVALDLRVDFAATRLAGTATLRVLRRDARAPLTLDTDGLAIDSVTTPSGPCAFRLEDADPVLGRALVIDLPDGAREVTITYATTESSAALQWLDPAQTAGGKLPFLFTQGQAILTRSWIPLQDTPGVRVTYDATIRVDPALGVVPLMSASVREALGDGAFHFAMQHPVPPYLIALAIGDLDRRELSPRCAVWAEPSVVARAAREFADTEQMVRTCEGLYGPYRWGRYDVLVLPPSFPFGGMENPCLTFATPTILAGDKSLVALIAHELAHSWSGNLVTNATWRDFWLNEGFTVYLEQRIVEAIYGPERARMETILGMQQLARELRELPKEDQRLHIDLKGRNPDDNMTAVPYDKGAAFLRRLEQIYGRERFDRFLTGWFDAHAFKSVTTEEFLDWLDAELLSQDAEKAAQIDVAAWVEGDGLPADVPQLASDAFDQVDAARTAWLAGTPANALATKGWTTAQWLHFLGARPADLTVDRMAELDAAFRFTQSQNAEIAAAWLGLAIARGYGAADARLEEFLLGIGRRKFLKPLYEALVLHDAARARAIYARARPRYHAVARRTIDTIVGWKG